MMMLRLLLALMVVALVQVGVCQAACGGPEDVCQSLDTSSIGGSGIAVFFNQIVVDPTTGTVCSFSGATITVPGESPATITGVGAGSTVTVDSGTQLITALSLSLSTSSGPATFSGTVVAAPAQSALTLVFQGTTTGPGFFAVFDSCTLISGDPQFVGLRGQSYQIHGVDGEVYNLISEKELQINARFVFLNSGECPIVNGYPLKNCWSHPGSYLGAIGIQQVVDGKVVQLAITAGNADSGFASIEVNGEEMKVGATQVNGAFSVSYNSSYLIEVNTPTFSFKFENSDKFINQHVAANVPLSQLTSHGLLGQTHALKLYPSQWRYIEGDVEDYAVADIFARDFVYNQFGDA